MKELTIAQKYDIASRELEDIKVDIQRRNDEAERSLDEYGVISTNILC